MQLRLIRIINILQSRHLRKTHKPTGILSSINILVLMHEGRTGSSQSWDQSLELEPFRSQGEGWSKGATAVTEILHLLGPRRWHLLQKEELEQF